MDVEELPDDVREFAVYLRNLLARLDQDAGWCGVFWQRDPDGMRACLAGGEVPPWDVVEALLQDLAADIGPDEADRECVRARALHRASLTAHDARPGGRDLLRDRLDVMLREQRYAAERQAELAQLLHTAATPEQAEALRLDLAWARDDHERATARCAELHRRAADLTRRPGLADREPGTAAGRQVQPSADWEPQPAVGWQPQPAVDRQVQPAADWQPQSVPQQRRTRLGSGRTEPSGAAPSHPAEPSKPAKERKRRPRGSARFAGMLDEADGADVSVPTPMPVPAPVAAPAPAPDSTSTPRGARFAGAADHDTSAELPAPQRPDDEARRATAGCVDTLVRLRAEGRGGEAHGVLVEAAHWPAVRFPLLAAELHRAGLGADWATLLWETASLPADLLVAAADALAAAGRTTDARQILRQGVARPAAEIGEAVLQLTEEGRHRETRALLDAYVRVRTPEEAARSAHAGPGRLVPLLVDAARGVSEERYWDVVHALRVAGFHA